MVSLLSFLQPFTFSLQTILEIVIFLGLAVQLIGIISMVFFYFKKAPPLPKLEKLPGVTLIKPCYGTQENEAENFEGFFRQKYQGPLQLLFVVSNDTDPVVPIIRDYLKRFPEADAQLVISKTRKSFRRKVDALYDGHNLAQHEMIIWSDSDVMVRENYIEEMVASLLVPGTSIVTTPQYDRGVHDVASAMKVLANNCDIGTYITLADWLTVQKNYAWGHSMGFRKKDFDAHEEEAWDIMNRFLADDQSLPYLFNKYGKRTVIRNIYCPVHCGQKKWSEVLTQKKRWAVCQRLVFPNRFVHLSTLLIYPQITTALLMLQTQFSQWSVGLFLFAAALKIWSSFQFEILFLQSIRTTLKYFWVICLSDLLQVYFFIHAFLVQTLWFHGKEYRVVDRYFLEEIKPDDTNSLELPLAEDRL